jgi:hypothetical protein
MAETTVEFDAKNPSHPVDLNIPVECAKYRIRLLNNIYELCLKSGLTTRMLNGKITSKEINHETKTILIVMNFASDQGYLFNYILDRSDISIDDLTIALEKANDYFSEYEISRQSQNVIEKYILGLGRYERTWSNLTGKPDYNLTRFKSRTLPYFNIECKDWVKANIEALKGEYPTEIVKAAVRTEQTKIKTADMSEFDDEKHLISRHNNFLEWNILPIDKYPNIDKLIGQILIFAKLGLVRYAYLMTMRLMISPKECHIVRSPALWKWLKPLMAENKDLEEMIRYCFSYAMYILRQEETIMFSQVNVKYRVIMTLEEASNLPTFNLSHLERSPYILQLTDGTPLRQTMPFYLSGKRSINSKEEFERRFNIATGGAFTGINLKEIGAAITGSILVPCVQKSPLEIGFEDLDWNFERTQFKVANATMTVPLITPVDWAFFRFLEYYYPSYASLKDADFKTQVLNEKAPSSSPVSERTGTVERDVSEPDIVEYEDDGKVIEDVKARTAASGTKYATELAFIKKGKKKTSTKKKQTMYTNTGRKIPKKNRKIAASESDEDSDHSAKHDSDNEEVVVEDDSEKDEEGEKEVPVTSTKKQLKVIDPPLLDKPSVEGTTEDKPTEDKPTEDKPVEDKPTEDKPTEDKPVDDKPVDDKPVEDKPVEDKPVEDKPTTPTEDTNPLDKDVENKRVRKGVDYNQLSDIDISITTRDNETFRERALQLYERIKANCASRGPVYIKQIETLASVKYKIYGPGIPRPMDIFRIPYDPAKMVKKFHVHAVKMYYDGDVTMFRSCVACLLSGVGECYKWFSCNKVAADVLLKYAQRGMTIILNERERTALSNYITDSDRWGPMFKTLAIKTDDIYCVVTERHPFFRPGLYESGCRKGLRPFERDLSNLYPNTLVVSIPKSTFPYGEVLVKDTKKIYPPNLALINSALEYIENAGLPDTEDFDDE